MAGEKQIFDQPRKVDAKVQHLLGEIDAARRREKDFRKEGRRILDIYNGKRPDSIPFNILYSNTETMLPALYNSQPRPVVQRRFKDSDPMGKAAATAGQRVLEFLVDSNSEEYSSFDSVMQDAVIDALLPGRGVSWVKYDADLYETKSPEEIPQVVWEVVCFDSCKWDRVIFGYSKKWSRTPWIAREHDVTRQEAEELFGAEIANKMTYTAPANADSDKEDRSQAADDKTDEDIKTAKVYEVWDKDGGRKVRFVSPVYMEGFLKEEDDPLGLTGFFPIPAPLKFHKKSNDPTPTALYVMYENQARELNRLTVRINRVAEAIKVRGAYDGNVGELEQLLKKDDNAMVAASNVQALQNGGLEKAIWLMPIEKLIVVLQQLYMARENCKKVIYEITGISDILRGSSVASETATAQEIKQQWGTLRIKRIQKEVQRYARDLLRIALEIAAKKFSERTFAQMTGLPFALPEMRQQAEMQMQAAAQAQMQPSPEIAKILAMPEWTKVLGLLRDNTQRQYRIDIETNSTIDVEASEDQKIMGEVLQAVSTFIQGVTPLVVSGSMPFEVAQSMLLAVVRRYRFGPEIEDYIKAMQAPKPPDDGKKEEAAAKMKMEQEKHQAEQQRAAFEFEQEKQLKMMDMKLKREEHELKRKEMLLKHQLEVQKLEIEREKGAMKLNQMRAEAQVRIAEARAMPKDKQKPNGGSRADS